MDDRIYADYAVHTPRYYLCMRSTTVAGGLPKVWYIFTSIINDDSCHSLSVLLGIIANAVGVFPYLFSELLVW